MRFLTLIFVLLLTGCTTMMTDLTDALAPPYIPQAIHVYNSAQFVADIDECSAAGLNWVPTFSFGSLATKTFDGATSNTSLIPISPLVPAYGAAGGAASAAADGLDIASGQHATVYRNCLYDEVQIDHSAVLFRPN